MNPDTDSAIDYKDLQRKSGAAARLMKALANSDRLLLMCTMVGGERCVSDLQSACGISQPTLSQQLAILRRHKLVKTRREGKRIYYTIKDPAVAVVLEALHRIFCPPAPRARASKTPKSGT